MRFIAFDDIQFYTWFLVVGFDEFKGCLRNQAYMVVDVREPKELAEDGKLIGESISR